MTILESLFQQAGFTDYEARAYLALCQQSPQTGYELAKNSRIPRANIYEVLQKLENRGAATKVVSNEAVRYLPTRPDAVLLRMKHDFSAMIGDMESHLAELTNPPSEPFVEQFQGYDNLLGFTRHQLDETKVKLLIGIHPAESARLSLELETLPARGVGVGILCLHGCKSPCRTCKGEFFPDPLLYRSPLGSRQTGTDKFHEGTVVPGDAHVRSRSLVVLSDESTLLAADIAGDKVFGLRTELPLLTRMAGLYMEQSILLAALLRFDEEGLALRQGLQRVIGQYSSILNNTSALLGDFSR